MLDFAACPRWWAFPGRSVRSQRSLVPSASTWSELDLLSLNKAAHQRHATIGLQNVPNEMAVLIIASQQDWVFFSLPMPDLSTRKKAKHIKDIHICMSSTCHLKNVKEQGGCFFYSTKTNAEILHCLSKQNNKQNRWCLTECKPQK